jgi:anti-sigma-K factor RskA
MYDDDRDALAAEYVLGTLSADERDQTEALLAIDPGFAEIIRLWERRLGELNVMVEAVEPPAEVWDKIKSGIEGVTPSGEAGSAFPALDEAAPSTAPEEAAGFTPDAPIEMAAEPTPEYDTPQDLDQNLDHDLEQGPDLAGPPRDLDDEGVVAALASSLLPPEPAVEQPKAPPPKPPAVAAPPRIERSADIIYLSRQARRWRGFTVAMSAIAALLALYIGVQQFAPALIPANRPSPAVVAGAPPPGARLVAVLQQEPTAPAFLLTVELQSRTLTVRRLTAAADADKSYELWLIPNKASSPHSLGLVGGSEFTTRPLPADFDVSALRAAAYAVSLEPAGGSTKGAPTGPVLFTGSMVESLPGSSS